MKLLITLGHNSSAIGIDSFGSVIAGYEEERLTRIKSDKSFPTNAINKVLSYFNLDEHDHNEIFITHWFDDFDFVENKGEHFFKDGKSTHRFNYELIENLIENYGFVIHNLSQDFTHHDSHASSAIAFLDGHINIDEKWNIVIADGFGNKQEVISIYESGPNEIKPILKKRYYGYKKSLGLMYQYATSAVGMKENQDEYKFLGYENKIKEHIEDSDLKILNVEIAHYIHNFIKMFEIDYEYNIDDDYINIDELNDVKGYYHALFSNLCNDFNAITEMEKRVLVGYFIQRTIEGIMGAITFGMENVILSGGIFYNVKLNNSIMKKVDKICVPPVPGDSGCAIGFYDSKYENFDYHDLCFGKRNLTINDDISYEHKDFDFQITYHKESFIDIVSEKLINNEMVQVVHGNMEFGPRALCNTSTLMLPTKENVECINKYNKRATIMPMAPVILEKNANYFFKDYDKIIASTEFMIITCDFKDNVSDKYEGVRNEYPECGLYSGRPQVITNYGVIAKILENVEEKTGYKALVNTSFNTHGMPIVYSSEDAIHDYKEQLKNKNDDRKLSLIIGDFEE